MNRHPAPPGLYQLLNERECCCCHRAAGTGHFGKLAEEASAMPQLFAVVRSRGAAWNDALPMEQQEAWQPHADFMDALLDDGFVVIGGPLEGTRDVLLIIRARDADEIASRLENDPWSPLDLLRITRIAPWTLRLGSLPPNPD
jgi:hypothetical protein